MVNVICEKCGKINDLPKGKSIESYQCAKCGGNLRNVKEDEKYHHKEPKREILSFKKIHTERMAERYTLFMYIGLILTICSITLYILVTYFIFGILSTRFYLVPIGLGVLISLEGYRKKKRWMKGAEGEKIVAEKLNELPKDYYIFNDVTIPTLKGNIDHVIIGPTGIFALETKNHSNNYTINGGEWTSHYRIDKIIYNNPGRQAKKSANILMKYLSSKGIGGFKLVNTVVILINDTFEIKKKPKNYDVLNPSQLTHYITSYSNRFSNKTVLESSLILKEHCSEFSYYK